jgi:hypothetical protein
MIRHSRRVGRALIAALTLLGCGRSLPTGPPLPDGGGPLRAMKLLLAVDRNASMSVDDPSGGVLRATENLFDGPLSDPKAFFSVSVMTFAGQAVSFAPNGAGAFAPLADLTPLDDDHVVQDFLAFSDGPLAPRDFLTPLAQIHDVIALDINSNGGNGFDIARYEVVFVSDGLASPPPGNDAVSRIADMGDVTLDTVHVFNPAVPLEPRCDLSTPPGSSPACDSVNDAARLLGDMAQAGHGTFLDFRNGAPVSFAALGL